MGELISKQCKFAGMIGELIVWIYSQGYMCRLGDAWRSTDKLKVPTGQPGFEDDEEYSYQDLLFYNKKSKVTYGKHNNRLALDLIIHKNGTQLQDIEYRVIGEKWEAMGGRWGGRFGINREEYDAKVGWDSGHFELS